MEEKKPEMVTIGPPAYIHQSHEPNNTKESFKSKSVHVYALIVSVALIVVIVLASVHYYRSLDVIHNIAADSYKKYHEEIDSGNSKPPVKQDIEIDTGKKIVVYRLSGKDTPPGSFAVLDYTKSLTGLYNPEKKECYLIAGIRNDVIDPKTLREYLEQNDTKKVETVTETLNYRKADDYPVGDKSILPAPLHTPCEYLPTYWLELQSDEKATIAAGSEKLEGVTTRTAVTDGVGKPRQKRGCYRKCWYVNTKTCVWKICYTKRVYRCRTICSSG